MKLENVVHAKESKRLPVVFSREEVMKIIANLEGSKKLAAKLIIRTEQEWLGHSDVKTTMIYTHVLNKGPSGVISPLDKM